MAIRFPHRVASAWHTFRKQGSFRADCLQRSSQRRAIRLGLRRQRISRPAIQSKQQRKKCNKIHLDRFDCRRIGGNGVEEGFWQVLVRGCKRWLSSRWSTGRLAETIAIKVSKWPAWRTGQFARAISARNWSTLSFPRTIENAGRRKALIRIDRTPRNCARCCSSRQPLLYQNQIAAQSAQLCLDIFVETGVADDCVDL
jgi:hypothetical protein